MQCDLPAERGEALMSALTESTPPPHVPVPPPAPVHVPLPPPPPGTAFALGWLMAGLFDDRRRRILDVRQPPFSLAVQLPLSPISPSRIC
jgi:hypothetical protein